LKEQKRIQWKAEFFLKKRISFENEKIDAFQA
jgi:hypothetical protein